MLLYNVMAYENFEKRVRSIALESRARFGIDVQVNQRKDKDDAEKNSNHETKASIVDLPEHWSP